MGDRLGIPTAVGFFVLMYTYKFGFLLLLHKIMYDCFIKVSFALWGKTSASKVGNRHNVKSSNPHLSTAFRNFDIYHRLRFNFFVLNDVCHVSMFACSLIVRCSVFTRYEFRYSFFFMFLTFVVVCFVLVMIQTGLCPIPLFKKTG